MELISEPHGRQLRPRAPCAGRPRVSAHAPQRTRSRGVHGVPRGSAPRVTSLWKAGTALRGSKGGCWEGLLGPRGVSVPLRAQTRRSLTKVRRTDPERMAVWFVLHTCSYGSRNANSPRKPVEVRTPGPAPARRLWVHRGRGSCRRP